MKKYLLFVSVLVGIFFTSCKMGVEKKESDVKTGVISLSLKSDKTGSYSNLSRTVGPVDWDVTAVGKWSVKFTSTDYTVTKEIWTSANPQFEFALPVGTYTIEVEGTVDANVDSLNPANNTPSYILYGKVTGIELTESRVEKDIPVSLKKTADGTGNFSYKLTLSELDTNASSAKDETEDSIEYTTIGAYKFKSYLTSVNNSNNKTQLGITGSKTDKFALAISADDVKSGFYYLTIEYTYDSNNYVVPLKDALVEIADGQTTKAEITDSDFEGVKVKNIYVDNNEESDFNGSIPDYVAGFNKSVSWLKEHQGAWTTANLYFIRPSEEAADFYDLIKAEAPYYDVSVNPTSSVSTEPGFGKTVNVYVDGALNYMLCNGEIGITDDCDNNMKLYLKSETKKDVKITAYATLDSDLTIELLLNNTTATISGMNLRKPNINVYIPEAAATAYDSETSEPILTIKSYGSVERSDQNIKLNVVKYYDESGIHNFDRDGTYTILSNTDSDKNMYCYTALAGQAGISIVAAIPEFTIEGSSELAIEDESETYKCCYHNKDDEKVEFDNSVYTIEWSLNGKTVGTNSSEFTLNPTTNKYVKIGENNLLVVVSKDGEYRSVNKIIKVKEPVIIGAIYQARNLYAVDLTNDSYKGEVSSLNKISSIFTDYAVDKKGYYYVAESDDETTYVKRYKDITKTDNVEIISDLNTATNGASAYKIYYDSDNDILYSAFLQDDTIRIEALSNISTVTTFTGIQNYAISTSGFSGLYDFAVYKTDAGLMPYFVSTNGIYYDDTNEIWKGAYPMVYTTTEVLNDFSNEISSTPINLYSSEEAQKALYKTEYDQKEKAKNDTFALYDPLTDEDEGYETAKENYFAAYDAFEEIKSTYNDYFSIEEQQKLITISDITVLNDKIYVLLREVGNESGDYFSSRGAVVEIDPANNNSLSTRYGYNSETALNVDDSSDANKYFFGPAKFVAIKPKKLFIADDGSFESSDETNSPDVDRIVTFDLETHSITNSESIKAKFDYETEWDSDSEYYSFMPVTN